MAEVKFSSRILRRFAETAALELGTDQFGVMLGLANLPAGWTKPEALLNMNPADSAKAYSALQGAMRAYFGRGARGVLLRVGGRLWNHLLEDATFGIRAQASVIKRLPLSTRRKPALDMLAKILGAEPGNITVHTLDLDLLLVDHASPTTDGHRESTPICFVTQGLIRESLLWFAGQGYDVEETACKAAGHHACEFKIATGK
ncbi:MAG TPA: V4R domain-containing protein [Anaerolineales bacterium]|nr:V4R domain-containing protein [Anaerolineales bacterium]